MRADRLLSILLLLQNRKKMKTNELASTLEVSNRTIFRDMEALSMAGIPVYAERGPQGGWMLSEGYRTRLTGMKASEIFSLFVPGQAQILDDLGMKADFENAFQKLLAETPSSLRHHAAAVRQKLHIDGAGWYQSNEQTPFLSSIQEAVWEERVLIITYKRFSDTVERKIQPLGLIAKRNVWYVVARVEDQAEWQIRTYRVSRLIHVQDVEEHFCRPDDFNLEAYWEKSMREFQSNLPCYPARIRGKKEVVVQLGNRPYVKVLHSQLAEEDWLEIDVQFETLDSATEIILSCGDRVQVIEPLELLRKVYLTAKMVVNLYR